MKNKIFTVTAADLNTGSVVQIDPLLIINRMTPTGITTPETWYPLQIRIENSSGVGVSFNILDDEQEFNEWNVVTPPNYYTFLPLPATSKIINQIVQKIYRVLILKDAGPAASGDLTIYAINYTQRGA